MLYIFEGNEMQHPTQFCYQKGKKKQIVPDNLYIIIVYYGRVRKHA